MIISRLSRRLCSGNGRSVQQLKSEIEALKNRLEDANRELETASVTNLETYPTEIEDYNKIPTFPERPSFKDFQNTLQPASQCVVFDGCPDDPNKPSSTPIYQTSTFVQPSASEFGPYDYTRSGNPTRTALEKHLAMLARAHAAFAFTSGMTALMAMTRLMVSVKIVDTTDLQAVEAAITPGYTSLLHMESPSNPMMLVSDIPALSKILHKHNVLLSVDSTMMPPILQRPLQLGADIEIHSLTKFFGGHSDAMGGAVLVNTDKLAQSIAFYQNAEGTALSPLDCWLFLRGIKTLCLRVERAQQNALEIAKFLRDHPAVTHLYYPGLEPSESDSDERKQFYKLHFEVNKATGGGCVMSFTTGDAEFSKRFINFLRIFKITVSFGSVNSLVEMPCLLSHASIPEEERTLPLDLVRLSIGIEDVSDLKTDIKEAFLTAFRGGSLQASVSRFDSKFEDLPQIPSEPLHGSDPSSI